MDDSSKPAYPEFLKKLFENKNDTPSQFNPLDIWVPRGEATAKLRSIYESGGRIAHIVGQRGAGKSSLALIFSELNKDLFPPGTTSHVYTEYPWRPFDLENIRTEAGDEPLLVIAEDFSFTTETNAAIDSYLRRHPRSKILTTSEEMPTYNLGAVINLSTELTDAEISEVLYRRLAVLGESSSGIVQAILSSPKLLAESRKSIRSLLAIANQVFGREASDFSQVTLYGPDGRHLTEDAAGVKRVALEIADVNEELLRILESEPELLRELPSRKFEEVVAELLSRQGYMTELTPPSKDGGFDMYAARKDGVVGILFLVECKRYVPPNKVGVEIVRALHGTVDEKNATGGIVVTTSFFTKGAKDFQQKIEHKMQLHDYAGIQEWLKRATTLISPPK